MFMENDEFGKAQKIELETFIDLFAGIGGFRLALESFGLKCVFSSELDKHASKTYCENFGESPAGDIKKIKADEIPSHDILCAGFPCQSFSISGKRKGFEDTRGTLFFDIARIVKYHKPKVILLENVKNFERHDEGRTLRTVLSVLRGLGYPNSFYSVLNASKYGVPTSRERIYIVCFREDLAVKKFNFPMPTYKKIYLKDVLENDTNTSEFEIHRRDIRFTKSIKQNPSLRPLQIGKINRGGQGERIYSIEGHAITLSAYGGGAAAKTGAYLVNNKIRKLTPRECARVMGFPDNFKIPVSKAQAYKQFGNGVAIPVIKEVMGKILETCGLSY